MGVKFCLGAFFLAIVLILGGFVSLSKALIYYSILLFNLQAQIHRPGFATVFGKCPAPS